jgi:hypothetical protein
MSGWVRVKRRRAVIAAACVLEALVVWYGFRALRLGHALVEVETGSASPAAGAVITHQFVMRSVATPIMYWGSLIVVTIFAVMLAAFIIFSIVRA